MSNDVLPWLIGGALFVHGVGHLLGFWMPVRCWLLPGANEKMLRRMSSTMTNCPTGEKSCSVDRTTSPVTQVALVDVNAASSHATGSASRLRAMGRVSKNAPRAMTAAYQSNEALAGYFVADPAMCNMGQESESPSYPFGGRRRRRRVAADLER